MRVILAGGGTGGHVIPALAIAHELRDHHHAEVLFIGTARGMENRLVPAAGYELRLVEVGALKKVSPATRIKTLFDLPRAVLKAGQILREFRPNIVIGVGGYASGPAMLAAGIASIPGIAFEPNVVPGLANRAVAPIVSAAAVQFEETCRYFRRCFVTGVPVRAEFFNVPPRSVDARPSLLVFGGSQGASAINKAVIASLDRLAQAVPEIHIVHQTGERDYKDAQAAYLTHNSSAEVYPFIDRMPQFFAGADLLLCRSGASTVAEVTASGKPAVFVPFPHATDDHQRRNAEALVKAGAALLIPEAELTPERLVNDVSALFADRRKLQQMSAAARSLAHPRAAAEIAELAVRIAA